MSDDGILSISDQIPPAPFVTEELTDTEVWKYRPPYQIQTPEERGPIQWGAHCQCGKISYVLKRNEPLNSKYCHCRGCQIMHGAPFQWASIFHKKDVSFNKGANGLSFYSSVHKCQEYEMPTKVYCSFCHTPIMDEGRNMCLIFPQLIDLKGTDDEVRLHRQVFKPTCHIFYEKRMMDIEDGLPKWSGMNDKSDLLDDRGNLIQSAKGIRDGCYCQSKIH